MTSPSHGLALALSALVSLALYAGAAMFTGGDDPAAWALEPHKAALPWYLPVLALCSAGLSSLSPRPSIMPGMIVLAVQIAGSVVKLAHPNPANAFWSIVVTPFVLAFLMPWVLGGALVGILLRHGWRKTFSGGAKR